MYKTLIAIIFSSISTIAQSSAFDDFFSKHPIDISLDGNFYEYSFLDQSGINGTLGGGIGWRYTFFSLDEFSVSSRVGANLGYGESDKYFNYVFQMPLTFNIGLGAGSSVNSDSKFGVLLSGGYCSNYYTFSREWNGISVDRDQSFFAPILMMSFNFKFEQTIFGIVPTYSWKGNQEMYGLKFTGYLLYD